MTRFVFLSLLAAGICSAEIVNLEVGPERELKTFPEAAAKLAELRESSPGNGVEIIIDGGRYELSTPLELGPGHSGTDAAPTVWKAAEGAKVEISGAREIRGFAVGADGLWRVKVPGGMKFEQLWVNGKRAVRARFPNEGTLPLLAVSEEKTGDGKARQTAKLDAGPLKIFSEIPKPEGLQVIVYHKWDNTRRLVETMDAATGTFTTVGSEMKSWNTWDDKSGIFFENAQAFLDAPGEWFLGNGELAYKPRDGENEETSVALVPMIGRILEISGSAGNKAAHMVFEGLSFCDTAWIAPAGGFDPEQAAASIGAAVEVTDAHGIVFRNCRITRTANYAAWFRKGNKGCVVENCRLEDLGAGGLRAGEKEMPKPGEECGGHRFTNNTILDGGHVFPCAVGVWIGQSGDNELSHNEIARFAYTGVSVGWRWGYAESAAKRNRIVFNHIHHIGDGELSDMGGVYTLGPSEGTVVSNNHIHHIDSKTYGGWGLYTDEGSTGILMENNLVHDTKSGGFHQHYGKENIIRNNIFAFAKDQQIQFTRPEEHLSFEFTRNIVLWDKGELFASAGWENGKVVMDHNLYWKTDGSEPLFMGKTLARWQQEKGWDLHSIVADPGFTDPRGGDWTAANREALEKIGFIPFDPALAGPR